MSDEKRDFLPEWLVHDLRHAQLLHFHGTVEIRFIDGKPTETVARTSLGKVLTGLRASGSVQTTAGSVKAGG